jgi:hypothetical protein
MALGTANPVVAQFRGLVSRVGQATLAQLYPNDFEAYFCSLELVDSRERVVDFFVFPIMPTSMRLNEQPLTNIKKTIGGVTVVSTSRFVPLDFEMQGNFGRQFKFLVGREIVDASAISFSTYGGTFTPRQAIDDGGKQIRNAMFNSQVKTGFGCLKILEAIVRKSKGLDEDGNPYHLYFYNAALNEHYLTTVVMFSPSMDQGMNMIWAYNLHLKLIAPIEGLKRDGSQNTLTKTMQYGIIGQAVDQSIAKLKNTVKVGLNALAI